MSDTIRVNWESLKEARRMLRKITREAEGADTERNRANMTHTACKLGERLDEALHGAIRGLDGLAGAPEAKGARDV